MDGWVQELVRRGVDRPYATQLVASHDSERIAQATAYFDSVDGAGPGLLVLAIREERKPRPERHPLLDAQQAFGEQIVTWLREHFPEWNHEEGNRTHTAAIATVIRLRHAHGWPLDPTRHAFAIRRAVERFDRDLEEVR